MSKPKTVHRIALAAVLALSSAMAAPTLADVAPSAPSADASTPQAKITVLTRQIESGSLSGKPLADAYERRASLYMGLRNFDAAMADFGHAISTQDDPLYHINRGMAFLVIGDDHGALDDFASVVTLLPKAPLGHMLRAEVFRRGENEAAYEEEFQAALKLSPHPEDILSDRAERYFSAGEFGKAQADYTAILAVAPDRPEIVSNRGDAEMGLGDYKAALDDYDRAIAMDAGRGKAPDAARNRITSLYALGRYADAAESASKLSAANPSEPYVLMWLLYSQSRLGKPDMTDFAKRAEKVDKTKWPWPLVAFLIGEENEEALSRAAGMGDSNAVVGQRCELQFHVGEWARIQGDRAKAEEYLTRASNICPPGFSEWPASRFELRNLGGTDTP